MPFGSTKELPKSVKDRLGSKEQKQFMAVFNSVFSDTKDEGRAFAAANSAVNKQQEINMKSIAKLMSAILTAREEIEKHGSKSDEDESSQDETWQTEFDIAKTDDDRQLVFGWLSVAVDKSGNVIIDSQDDIIEEEVLEKAAYDFTLNARIAGNMHKRIDGIGKLVESMVFTIEKQEALGIPEGVLPVGWWCGFHISDDETWGQIKSGELNAFSIGGKAMREEV